MKIESTAYITITTDTAVPSTNILHRDLDLAIEEAVDRVLDQHGIANSEVHSSILDALITE